MSSDPVARKNGVYFTVSNAWATDHGCGLMGHCSHKHPVSVYIRGSFVDLTFYVASIHTHSVVIWCLYIKREAWTKFSFVFYDL